VILGFCGLQSEDTLQEIAFPGGILFDRKNDSYRTERVNSLLELTHSFSKAFQGNKNGQTKENFNLPAWVVPTGIEPASKV
jgi:hypothetical protein